MYCSNCGAKNSDDSKFCDNCGSTIIEDEKPEETLKEETVVEQQEDVLNEETVVEQQDNYQISEPAMEEVTENQQINEPVIEPTKEESITESKTTNVKTKKKNNIVIILVAILLIAAIAGGVYFFFFKDKKTKDNSPIPEDELLPNMVLDDNGIPKFIEGKFTDKKVTDEKSALEALEDVKDIMQINDVSKEFENLQTQQNSDITYYKFQQKYDGLKVYNGQIIISANDKGEVKTLSGKYISNIKVDKNIKSQTEIDSILKKKYDDKIEIISAEKQIYNKDDNSKIVYVYIVSTEKDICKMIVDAKNGEIIESHSIINNFQYTAQADDGKTYTVNLKEEKILGGTDYEFHDEERNISILNGSDIGLKLSEGEDIKIFNSLYLLLQNGIANLHTFAITAPMYDGKLIEIQGTKTIPHAIITQANLAKVYDYYKDILGRKSYDNKGSEIIAFIDVQEDAIIQQKDWFNACWVGSTDEIKIDKFFIGSNEGITLAQAYDVIAHEYTHAVSGSIVHFSADGEAGSLNEAYSDIMGYIIEGENYTMGEDMNYVVRDISDPNKYKLPKEKGGKYFYPTDKSIYTDEWLKSKGFSSYENYDNNGAHTNMSVPSYAAYLMEKNGAFKDKEEMAKVWYNSLFYLTSHADFEDCALAVINSAEYLGLSEKSLEIIEQAFVDTKMMEPRNAKFSGKVTDDKNKPLKNVEVKVINSKNDEIVYKTYTNEEGKYSFDKLPKGEYKVKYSKHEYSTVEKKIELDKDISNEDVVLSEEKIDTTYCNPKKHTCVVLTLYSLESENNQPVEKAHKYYVKKGSKLKELGLFTNSSGYFDVGEFTDLVKPGWYYRGTDKLFDSDTTFEEDVELEIKIAGMSGNDMIDFSKMFGNLNG